MIPQLTVKEERGRAMGMGEGKEKMKRAALQMARERESQEERPVQRALGQEDPGSITGRHHFAHACRPQGGPGAIQSKIKKTIRVLRLCDMIWLGFL